MAVLFDRQNDKRGSISKGLHENSSDKRGQVETSACQCFGFREFVRSRRKSGHLVVVAAENVAPKDCSFGEVYQSKTHFRMISSSFYNDCFIAVLFYGVHFCFIKKYYFNSSCYWCEGNTSSKRASSIFSYECFIWIIFKSYLKIEFYEFWSTGFIKWKLESLSLNKRKLRTLETFSTWSEKIEKILNSSLWKTDFIAYVVFEIQFLMNFFQFINNQPLMGSDPH